MPKYHAGLTMDCPLDNLVLLGTNIPKWSGAPGKEQTPGVIVELSSDEFKALKADAKAREIRRYDGGRCSAVFKEQDRDGEKANGVVIRGPSVHRVHPLGEYVYVVTPGDAADPIIARPKTAAK